MTKTALRVFAAEHPGLSDAPGNLSDSDTIMLAHTLTFAEDLTFAAVTP